MLQDRLGLSERRACRVTGQHRSTQRRPPARGRGDDALRTELHAFSRGHPRWGYRRAWATLREEGWGVNRKRVQRLWREEGLRVPAKRRKRQRLGDSAVPAARLRAERPNHVWALDFQFDQTADGRVLKLLNIVDEHTREALAIVAARRINADATAATLEGIVAVRGTAPAYIRCDNGPELTANALRDWCLFSGTGSSYIEPGAPWENPYVESFNGRLRDEFLAVEQFDSLLEAQVLIEDWRIEYNTKRPHSSLGWLAPACCDRSRSRPSECRRAAILSVQESSDFVSPAVSVGGCRGAGLASRYAVGPDVAADGVAGDTEQPGGCPHREPL